MSKQVSRFGEVSAGEDRCYPEECRSVREACSGSAARKLDVKRRPGGCGLKRGAMIALEQECSLTALPFTASSAAAASVVSFRPLALSDREAVAGYLAKEGGIAADQCFGTLYLWGSPFGLLFAEYGGRFIPSYGAGEQLTFGYPAGEGELAPVLELMREKAEAAGASLVLRGISDAQREALEKACPGCFSFEENREGAEYVYEAQALASLAGRKLHGKRNHCSRFEKEQPDWRAEELTPAHVTECMALVEKWEEGHSGGKTQMQQAELQALRKTFDGFEALQMDGMILYAAGRPVAFSIGERVGKDCFDVHFEKADVEVNGAYTMVNREFVRLLLEKYPELRLINREEDMGLENLRKAKESYRPAFLVNKYTARWIRP